DGLVVNSFAELEPLFVVSLMPTRRRSGKKIWAVGPLFLQHNMQLSATSGSDDATAVRCGSWLEQKKPRSVVLVVCASFVAAAVVGLASTPSVYRLVPPAGSPLKGACQVLVAFSRKANVRVPDAAAELYAEEHVKAPLLQPPRESLEHTDQFRWLDKAAVVTSADLEDGNPWRLCTVNQVEEVKTLLQLIPIWLTSATPRRRPPSVWRVAFSVPAASLTCIETVFVVASIALYNRAAAPAARRFFGRAQSFSPLQLMGLGHGAVVAALVLAACWRTSGPGRRPWASRGCCRSTSRWPSPPRRSASGSWSSSTTGAGDDAGR
ncbi:hypothetical protein ACJX0J_041178, partial [Zea mays]